MNKNTIIIVLVICVICIVILYIGICRDNKDKEETNLKIDEFKDKIFPIKMDDIELNSDLRQEKYYTTVANSLEEYKPDYTLNEFMFFLKFKKFLESDNVNSMGSDFEIERVQKCMENITKDNIQGCLIETGVWKGGMAMWMKVLDKHKGKNNRKIYLFDTFEYFPTPDGLDFRNLKDHKIHTITKVAYDNLPSVENVRSKFEELGLLDDNIIFVKGEIENTVNSNSVSTIDKISLLRIDSDYYSSVSATLNSFYHKISKGGFIIIDDYNNPVVGTKDAVDEFRKQQNINIPIINENIEGSVYWRIPF